MRVAPGLEARLLNAWPRRGRAVRSAGALGIPCRLHLWEATGPEAARSPRLDTGLTGARGPLPLKGGRDLSWKLTVYPQSRPLFFL